MSTVLLTGFEPFGGSSINPSAEIVRSLAADPPAGWRVTTSILPVDHQRAPDALIAAVEIHLPDVILCFGEAGRSEICVERVAVNLLDFGVPDNGGAQIEDELIAFHGPAAYFATLPVKEMVADLRHAGIPARQSLTAGAFLCNQALYILLAHLAERDGGGYAPPAGFIHVPRLPAQVATGEKPGPSMDLRIMIRAVRVMLQTVTPYL